MSKGEGSVIIPAADGFAPRGDPVLDAPAPSESLSRHAQRVARRYPDLWSTVGAQELHSLGQSDTNAGADTRIHWQSLYAHVLAREPQPKSALRALRQIVIAKLSVHDQRGALGLACVTRVMTGLAEFALIVAQQAAMAEVSQRHGMPLGQDRSPLELWIVGMGKLGGRELNVSSDIDLIYLYTDDGETQGLPDGSGVISNHEFFTKCARTLQAWIADVTEHGFVFRVDLALRPHGMSGPVACSLASLRDYLMAQGREWERLAWMKSRVVAPKLSEAQAQPLRDLVTPFVYRRYLDYPVFDALRDLHRQIREQATRKALGRASRGHDVKLGRGGIREIEFLVQSQQIVRGGQFPELRTRSTLKGLAKLAHARLVDAPLAELLAQDYRFLRNLEHAIQYQDDAQTHELPTADADLAWVSALLGFATPCGLLRRLDETRERVATAFDGVLGPGDATGSSGKCKGCNCPETAPDPDLTASEPGSEALRGWLQAVNQPELLSAAVLQRLQALAKAPRRLALKPADDARLSQLVQAVLLKSVGTQCSETAALRCIDWIDGLLRREGYLALLIERPRALERALRLLGSSRWAMRYLQQHPSVVDELASEHWLVDRFDPEAFLSQLQARRGALALGAEDDEESLMNLLRRAHQAEVFRTLARDLEGLLSVEAVADDLSCLAEAVVHLSLQWIWQDWWQRGDKRAHQAEADLVVLAYGKLGGKELGYGSDLDLVFVHGDAHDKAQECYAALAKKLINWLTTKTALGDLYEIDTALRPNGNAGLLVTHIDAFEQYQNQRGSNAAWTWEHQAITRARVVYGPSWLSERVEATRVAVLQSERDAAALKLEISAMRQRMRLAHPAAEGMFELKHSVGGMIDVEFGVQAMVLLHARAVPALLSNLGNIALLHEAQAHGLLPGSLGHAAAQAYREYRAQQHARRLNEEALEVPAAPWQTQRDTIKSMWSSLGLI